MSAFVSIVAMVLAGIVLWTLAEYLLHRFAMHALGGKGIMSREHLEHHVHAQWHFSYTHLLSWAGVFLVGGGLWAPIGYLLFGPAGAALGAGWIIGYFLYEYEHAISHLRGPAGRYSTWLRRHHLHHHFGNPLSNHGVSIALWDIVFGTREVPERVRVPRRMALPWMLDGDGELHPHLADDYVMVGNPNSDERLAALDRARAFASTAPVD